MHLTIEGDSIDEIFARMRDVVAAVDRQSGGERKSVKELKTDKSCAPQAPATPTKEASDSQPRARADQSGGADFTAISHMIPPLVAKIGKVKTLALLKEFGASRASELKPEQFSPFLSKATGLLTATESE